MKLQSLIRSDIRSNRLNRGLALKKKVASGPGPAVTIFDALVTPSGSDLNIGYTFRVELPITGPLLDEVRVTIRPGANLTILGMGFGELAGNFGNTVEPIVELKFAGASGFVNKSTDQVSDWTSVSTLSIPGGGFAVVTYTTGPSGQAALAFSSGNQAGVATNYQSGTHWNIQNVDGTGFSDSPGVVYAIVKVETRSTGGGGGGGGGEVIPSNVIPMSFYDPIFTSMSEITSPILLSVGQVASRRSIIEQSGDPSIMCLGNNEILLSRVNSRECVRITGGTLRVDQCYLEAKALAGVGDHADVLQAYSPGDVGHVILSNSFVKAYNIDATGGYFTADSWSGDITVFNTIFNGGPYGLIVYVDPGCHVNISLEDVFFVGPFANGQYAIAGIGGGTYTITKWTGVKNATIVDGVLVPGTSIPSP